MLQDLVKTLRKVQESSDTGMDPGQSRNIPDKAVAGRPAVAGSGVAPARVGISRISDSLALSRITTFDRGQELKVAEQSRPRPKVSVSVGGKAPSTLGMSALLDFDVQLTLNGRSLSPKEIDTLLASTEGLVLIKGTWVEVDREKLGQVLDQWRDVQRQAFWRSITSPSSSRSLAGNLRGYLSEGDTQIPGYSGTTGITASHVPKSLPGSTAGKNESNAV